MAFDNLNEQKLQEQEKQIEQLNVIGQLINDIDINNNNNNNNTNELKQSPSSTSTTTTTNSSTGTQLVIKEFYDNMPKDKKSRKEYLKQFKQSVKQEKLKLKEIKKSMKSDKKEIKFEKKCVKKAKYGRHHGRHCGDKVNENQQSDFKNRMIHYKFQHLEKKRLILLTKLQKVDNKINFFNNRFTPSFATNTAYSSPYPNPFQFQPQQYQPQQPYQYQSYSNNQSFY